MSLSLLSTFNIKYSKAQKNSKNAVICIDNALKKKN